MNSTSNKLGYGWRRGVTLPELMVAVAITVGMLLLTGMVFKSATDASGQSMAYQEILQQARAVMQQLDQDFRGLRPDLPMAIIFEEDSSTSERYDRIVFFANGDFQATLTTPSYYGNLARIFYGQSENQLATPDGADNRKILTRRYRILSPIGGALPNDFSTWNGWSSENFDDFQVENASLSFWRNELFVNFQNHYFLHNLNEATSMIRRPDLKTVFNTIGDEAVQKLYLLPDVTNFRIEPWFAGAGSWFPNPRLLAGFDYILQKGKADYDPSLPIRPVIGFSSSSNYPFALYWNVAGAPAEPKQNERDFDRDNLIDWRPDAELGPFSQYLGIDLWPSALKFTFTLYDKGRRYYPEGVTFEYIVKLPPRP